MTATHNFKDLIFDNDLCSMTTQKLAKPQSVFLGPMTEAHIFKDGPPGVSRSSSDSAVTANYSVARPGPCHPKKGSPTSEPSDDVAVHTSGQGTLVVAARSLPPSSLASRAVKVGQKLQLPSFHALGIANSVPNTMLTPPDEASLPNWIPMEPGQTSHPVTTAHRPSTELTTCLDPHSLSSGGPVLGVSSGNSDPRYDGPNDLFPAVVDDVPERKSMSSNDSHSNSDVPQWLEPALAAICKFTASSVCDIGAQIDLGQYPSCLWRPPTRLSIFCVTLNRVPYRRA